MPEKGGAVAGAHAGQSVDEHAFRLHLGNGCQRATTGRSQVERRAAAIAPVGPADDKAFADQSVDNIDKRRRCNAHEAAQIGEGFRAVRKAAHHSVFQHAKAGVATIEQPLMIAARDLRNDRTEAADLAGILGERRPGNSSGGFRNNHSIRNIQFE